ncbi:hypothetical protein KCP78_01880 [Salmonella enterica subsp. enterica]|nr:hypothetical protein KCP78_01880 [Salmonella enterica subsp. enterica]
MENTTLVVSCGLTGKVRGKITVAVDATEERNYVNVQAGNIWWQNILITLPCVK